MTRLRAACLVAAAMYAGLHLFFLLTALPMMLRPTAREEIGGWPVAVLFIAAYTALGVCGVWWPLAALARPGRRFEAIRCAVLATLYAALFLAAWLPDRTPMLGTWRHTLSEAGAGLVAAGFAFVLLSFGWISDPAVPAALYVAALLTGAALTLRQERSRSG